MSFFVNNLLHKMVKEIIINLARNSQLWVQFSHLVQYVHKNKTTALTTEKTQQQQSKHRLDSGNGTGGCETVCFLCRFLPKKPSHSSTTACRGRAVPSFFFNRPLLCNILLGCTLLMPQRRNKKSQSSKKQAYNYFTVLAEKWQ